MIHLWPTHHVHRILPSCFFFFCFRTNGTTIFPACPRVAAVGLIRFCKFWLPHDHTFCGEPGNFDAHALVYTQYKKYEAAGDGHSHWHYESDKSSPQMEKGLTFSLKLIISANLNGHIFFRATSLFVMHLIGGFSEYAETPQQPSPRLASHVCHFYIQL